MATFREAREALLFAYQDGSIDDTEFALLYDINSSGNLEFPYWKYAYVPTLPDYPGVSRIRNESPGLPYGSLNLPDKNDSEPFTDVSPF